MEGLGKSQGSLLSGKYETLFCTQSVLKTDLYGIFQPHPHDYMVRAPGDILKDETAHMESFSP